MGCNCGKNKVNQIQNSPVSVKVTEIKKKDELVEKIVNKLKSGK